ncbi:hypothetical protein [Halopseudomonas salegens]|uniref:Uncharacterized protein n=1 Tax=Halopseudomonas salegens TaxID=1434072 RepID=A0A1H2F064_9GAMM|nr:hypothetical protein [Halopseudomonas salegens]SDU00368.1 hypothetical protein SAMN05216210_1158 [Halopseudomonas salegens]
MTNTDDSTTEVVEQKPAPPRDIFARSRPSDMYWLQLKPVFRNRQMVHNEALLQIAVTQDRIGSLELLRLQVRKEGEPLPTDGNTLEVLIDHKHQRVRFGPLGAVNLNPAGRGLGGFMLGQLIDWCQRLCPEYSVTPITLNNDQASTEEERKIRENLLQRVGFTLNYTDDKKSQGRAQANRVKDLLGSWNSDKVQPLSVSDLLRQLREKEAEHQKQTGKLNALKARLEVSKRNDLSHRFAIGCLIIFAIFQALLLLWVVLR